MPRMTVHMFGIMYFNLPSAGGATVLLPDATQGEVHIPPHNASLFVERTHYQSHYNWPVIEREVPILTIRSKIIMVPVLEFRIASFSDVTFPADHETPNVDVRSLRQALVHMQDIDPQFRPDLTGGGSIARVQITSGTLEAFTFNRNVNAVQWAIRSGAQPLTISAGNGSVTLKPRPDSLLGAEVVFSNTQDYLADLVPGVNLPRGHDGTGHGASHVHHFGLFGKIDLHHGSPRFPRHRMGIEYTSAMMAAMEDAVIESDCTPPCCTG
jgi:hypothetical protein